MNTKHAFAILMFLAQGSGTLSLPTPFLGGLLGGLGGLGGFGGGGSGGDFSLSVPFVNLRAGPGGVSVQAPFTDVNVGPNGDTSVSAPFTNVQAGPSGVGVDVGGFGGGFSSGGADDTAAFSRAEDDDFVANSRVGQMMQEVFDAPAAAAPEQVAPVAEEATTVEIPAMQIDEVPMEAANVGGAEDGATTQTNVSNDGKTLSVSAVSNGGSATAIGIAM